MIFAFDLISDLHLETHQDQFDWTGQPTSPVAVVVGDIARDHKQVRSVLRHLGECYAAVFYIDGNDEHRFKLDRLGESYSQLARTVKNINRVTYLQDNVVVIDGVAIVGTNGWWTFDLDPDISMTKSKNWMLKSYLKKHPEYQIDPDMIANAAKMDAAYLIRSVARLQTHSDVKKICVVTHTVPSLNLIQHDLDFANKPIINCMGNPYLSVALNHDTEKKITTWCFGHYHSQIDTVIDDVRYVNNCRGRGDTVYHQAAYFPRRIEIQV